MKVRTLCEVVLCLRPSTMDFEFPLTSTILGWLVFGGIGMIAVGYAKMKEMWQPFVLGVALMIFPYFIPSGAPLWLVGLALTVALFFTKD